MIAFGLLLGLVGTALSFLASWAIIRLASASQQRKEASGVGAALVAVGFLAKLPILVGMGLAAQRIGPLCMTGFLIGLGIAYVGLLCYGFWDGFSRAKSADPSRYVVLDDEPRKTSKFDDD